MLTTTTTQPAPAKQTKIKSMVTNEVGKHNDNKRKQKNRHPKSMTRLIQHLESKQYYQHQQKKNKRKQHTDPRK